MFSIRVLLSVTLVLLFTLSLNSCKQTGCTDPTSINYDPEATESSDDCEFPFLMLHLHPTVSGEELTLGNTYIINGRKVQINTAQFYVSGIQIGADGTFDELDTYLLVKGGMHMYPTAEISTGSKNMLKLNVGVDSVTNHADPTLYEDGNPLAFQVPSMHWSWDNGYIFIRLEGLVDSDGNDTPDKPFEYHIGKDANLQAISLPIDFEAGATNVQLNLMVDYAKFFDGLDLSKELITHTGNDPVLAAKIANNAQKVFSAMP